YASLQFKPPLTMIIPYGLKSWLESISRAILIERPKQIPEFIATYCEELLKFRECDLKGISDALSIICQYLHEAVLTSLT
uniref:RIIa domain-containing protein n=1 Tax=Esox lucius TaxID=8010 RepID=A0A3P8YP58_ESOLU